jgi:hypothetical protein
MRRSLAPAVIALLTLWGSGAARAEGRQGEGRISLAVGPRGIPNDGFLHEQRLSGTIFSSWGLGPAGLATFGYWLDDRFELSLEGGYGYDDYRLPGKGDWRINTATLGGTLRFAPSAIR